MRRGFAISSTVYEEGDIMQNFVFVVWMLRELVLVIIACLEYIDNKRSTKKSALIDTSEQTNEII
jgi:hypothetical protein